ncbi:DUF1822 family protein [Aerosakkonemataceae cyanobacterium BLCC-F50]|uniref:DUF1822 family protein n=1 Tax=Floridaenema flaviceps BLCC-F50 TaxID=3153642 RepID=A0ABV4XJL1_9CYAN
MTYTSCSMFTVPLTSKAYKLAKSFQSQYENPAKATQVYLNTLAVYAVNTYCQCLSIETNLEASESLNPVMQSLMNIADLEIEGIGKLECRPVLPEDEDCFISAETWSNRLGYVAVEINDSSREATLLGFYLPAYTLEMRERIYLKDFQPLETLLDYLDRLKSAIDFFYVSDDEVVEKILKRFDAESLSSIVVQLERVYRLHSKKEWRYAGGESLANYVSTQEGVYFQGDTPTLEKEEDEETWQQSELQDLAQELLEKLDNIWGGDVQEKELVSDFFTSIPKTVQPNQSAIATPNCNAIEGFIPLSEWLRDPQNMSEHNFQTLESYLTGKQGNEVFRFATAPRSRSAETGDISVGITGVKEIQLAEYLLALIIGYRLESADKRDILLRLYPTGNNTYLPAGVHLIVLDENGDIFLQATARNADNWIQLEFRGELGERFSIKVGLGDAEIVDYFVL